MVTKPNNWSRRTSSINPPKSAVWNLLGPLFMNPGPSHWSKKSLVSSNNCQVMWEHLIQVNFYLTAFIEGWFNTLHSFNTWSYRGQKYPNNTHNNAANVSNISFNSHQFLGGRLGSYFRLKWSQLDSCALGFRCRLFLPNIFFNLLCSPWYHHQWWNTTFRTFIHCHRASWLEIGLYHLLNLQIDE